MKMTLPFAVVLCLLVFVFAGLAQPPQIDRQDPMVQQAQKNALEAAFRSIWEGRGANLVAAGVLNDPDVRIALGVSEEQYQNIRDAMGNIGNEMQNHPDYQKFMEEVEAAGIPDNPAALQNVDAETMDKLLDIQRRLSSFTTNYMSDCIGNALTPEQKHKIGEAQLASLGELPVISPSMFEVLGLSDDQKQEMKKIKKDFEPEFEKTLESFTNSAMMMLNKSFSEHEKQQGIDTEEIQNKLMAEDPEYKRVHDELMSTGKAFATRFKTKMFDILTDAQWMRLQELIDHPPVHARVYLKSMKAMSGEAEKSGGGWSPGPHSWRPGDPIPVEYRQERNTRRGFPRSEQ